MTSNLDYPDLSNVYAELMNVLRRLNVFSLIQCKDEHEDEVMYDIKPLISLYMISPDKNPDLKIYSVFMNVL